jgi:glycosyltransferase involved in cell wall biosynthesis
LAESGASGAPVIFFLAKVFRTDSRVRQEAKSLVGANYSVFVLAWSKGGKFRSIENLDGATVRSYGLLSPRSRLGLALGALVFQAILFLESLRIIVRLKQKPIVHAHDFNTLLPGCLLALFRLSAALVYDAHELTYAAYSEFFSSKIGNIIRAIEERFIRCAMAIITVTPEFARYYSRFGRKTEVVFNCPRASDIPRASRLELRTRLGLAVNAFIVSYIGTARYDSRFDLLLSVAQVLREDERVLFLVVGCDERGLPLSSYARLAKEAGARVTFLPFTSRDKALAYVAASDLTWAIYDKRSLNMRLTLPWKLFESLACRVPVIVDNGTARAEFVKKLKCGLVAETDDPAHISELIVSLVDNPARLRDSMLPDTQLAAEFTWESMSGKLIEVYKRLRQNSRKG